MEWRIRDALFNIWHYGQHNFLDRMTRRRDPVAISEDAERSHGARGRSLRKIPAINAVIRPIRMNWAR